MKTTILCFLLFMISFLAFPQKKDIINLNIPDSVDLQLDPLHVGNKWIYKGTDFSIGLNDSIAMTIKVEKDTVLSDGYTYRKLVPRLYNFFSYEFRNPFYERIDSATGQIVFFRTIEESPYQYLSGENLTQDTSTNSRFHNISCSVEPVNSFYVWGKTLKSKTYLQTLLQGYIKYNLVEGIGMYNFTYHYDFETVNINLIGCIVNGIVYGDTNSITAVNDKQNIPEGFNLYQNYPNPFNPVTVISYTIPNDKDQLYVRLKIYDSIGREVATLVNGYQKAGTYQVPFSSDEYKLSSGVYFYKISVGDYTAVKKMMLLR